jgi:hypothetical protein
VAILDTIVLRSVTYSRVETLADLVGRVERSIQDYSVEGWRVVAQIYVPEERTILTTLQRER